jgi:hypothetical protein
VRQPERPIRELRFSPDMDLEPLNLRPAGVTKRVDRERLLVLDDVHMILNMSDPDDVPAELLGAYLDAMDYVSAVKTTDVLTDVYGQEERRDRVIGLLTADALKGHKNTLELTDLLTDPAYAGAAEFELLDRLKREMWDAGWYRLVIRTPVGLGMDDYLAQVADRHAFAVKDVKRDIFIWQWPPQDAHEGKAPEWRSSR